MALGSRVEALYPNQGQATVHLFFRGLNDFEAQLQMGVSQQPLGVERTV